MSDRVAPYLLFFLCCVPMRLHRFFPDATIRAFADDNAMVVPIFWQHSAGIFQGYRESSKMSPHCESYQDGFGAVVALLRDQRAANDQ